MGCSSHYGPLNLGPCANCGKENSARMGSSAWGHQGSCCGEACGQRLAAKIKNGMAEAPDGIGTWNTNWNTDSRVLDMRIRIKQLSARVKALKGLARDAR